MLLVAHRAIQRASSGPARAFVAARVRGAVPEPTRKAHEKWSDMLAASWERLDTPERLALSAWGLVRTQVRLLQQDFKKDKHEIIIDMGATWLAFDSLSVPTEWRARVWRGVLLLHDFEHHDGRGHEEDLCIVRHKPDPLTIADPKCPRCKARWVCLGCGQLFAFGICADC